MNPGPGVSFEGRWLVVLVGLLWQERLRRLSQARLGSVSLSLVRFVLRQVGLSQAKLGLVRLGWV